MEVRYYPNADMLNFRLADKKSVESEEVIDGFVFDFDDEGKVVGIEVEDASTRVNLTFVQEMPSAVVNDSVRFNGDVYTASEMATRLDIDKRTFNRIVRSMRESGLSVGLRPDLAIYTSDDESSIQQWRDAHPRGRPRSRVQA